MLYTVSGNIIKQTNVLFTGKKDAAAAFCQVELRPGTLCCIADNNDFATL